VSELVLSEEVLEPPVESEVPLLETVLGAELLVTVCLVAELDAVLVAELWVAVVEAVPVDVPAAAELDVVIAALVLSCSALALDANSAMIAPAPMTDPAATLRLTRRRRRRAASRFACELCMTVSLPVLRKPGMRKGPENAPPR
jgi:hypothetical protein